MKYIYDHKVQIKDSFVFNKVLDYLKENNLLPSLVFVFSRKQCHTWANMIQKSLFEEGSKIPSIIEKEAKQILIKKLTNWKEYVELPEFRVIVKLLEKGVAVHHSGVTPVFREMIEILYRKQYIKLLVATETFAIGVNVAIKSVIYTGLQKYDGKRFRFIYSHEYAQGAGRAGRRGKDTKGVVITQIDGDSPINYLNVENIIIEADGIKIKTVGDLKNIVNTALRRSDKTIEIVIINNQNQKRSIGVKLD